jgi:hypothetical protein
MAVDTKHVQGRRQLRFSSYDEMLADVDTLAAHPCRQLGNWSLGEICDHLAKAMDMAVDGPPFTPPWYVRLIGPFFKSRFLRGPMPSGFQLPKNASRLTPAPTAVPEGVARLKNAVDRICANSERAAHGVFGRLTREEWDQLMLRHCEMHLGFLVPE